MDVTPAIDLCRRFEGFRPRPYLCPAGVPTIGYGTTRYLDGKPVTLDDAPITETAARVMLIDDLRTHFGPAVLRLCPGLIAFPARFNAILDFTYNLGAGRLQTSTLRRCVNAQDWDGAVEQLNKWVRGGGRVLPGLVARRAAESQLLR
ncbi:COG3772 Phage-related lysozyme (muraminidase) [uncultured Caudovirales phage]|uniref:Endolysin n=1 Tax=uncultured Caudovirales phage TaxID=2100421 RepID=A0A6J5NCQ4_9CAUD|nr:COG3772 Phage-related lysozyme (muraminidase) [uncultured Caudovirales phage]